MCARADPSFRRDIARPSPGEADQREQLTRNVCRKCPRPRDVRTTTSLKRWAHLSGRDHPDDGAAVATLVRLEAAEASVAEADSGSGQWTAHALRHRRVNLWG